MVAKPATKVPVVTAKAAPAAAPKAPVVAAKAPVVVAKAAPAAAPKAPVAVHN